MSVRLFLSEMADPNELKLLGLQIIGFQMGLGQQIWIPPTVRGKSKNAYDASDFSHYIEGDNYNEKGGFKKCVTINTV